MFGIYKNNILDQWENILTEGRKDELVKKYKDFLNTMKSSKPLQELYETYNFLENGFENKELAKIALDESISHLQHLNLDDVALLEKFTTNLLVVETDSLNYLLDKLIFEYANLNVQEKAELKLQILEKIYKPQKETDNVFREKLSSLIERIEGLNEDQKTIIELFLDEKNTDVITELYKRLIQECENKVEDKILTSNDEYIKPLLEVKRRLLEMKTKTPMIEDVESLIDLNENLS